MMPGMARLAGKVALITGGARGQGAAEAALFAAEGARVFITDVLDDEGAATAAACGGRYRRHDVTDETGWQETVDWVVAEAGRLDVLVNNAGIFRVVPMRETTVDLWHRIMDVNALGVFIGMRTAAPAMIASGGGSIVNISSIAGMHASPTAFAYGASKWAVRGMSKSAAVELAPSGVRVNSVHPGIIDTEMITEVGPDWRTQLSPRIPMGRPATADEVARLVLFLASDESSYCTGHEYLVDGGIIA